MALSTRHSSHPEIQPARPAMEPLESRAYFSSPTLIVTFPDPLPPSAIAGVTVNEKIAVNIANNGPGALKGGFSISLFTSIDQTLSIDDSQVAVRAIPRSFVIASGKNRTLTVNVKAFPENLDDSYYLLAKVGQGNSGATIGASTSTIDVLPKTIDFSDVVPSIRANGHLGHLFPVTVDVSNGGNVIAQGKLRVDFGESISTTGSSPVDLGTIAKPIHIKPGKIQVLHFLVPLPLGIPSGNQFIVADVDPADLYNESNLANNTAVSPNPVSLT